MANKRQYQKELEQTIEGLRRRKSLLLHSCCAPCSSFVLEYLRQYFSITVYYYNPNITDREEYEKRVQEEKRLIQAFVSEHPEYPISFLEGPFEPERFFQIAEGKEDCPEGGERCFACYGLRLAESVKVAEEMGFDYITTTLSISPLKNADKLNEIGEQLCQGKQVTYLTSDFKKKNGYKRSVELSQEYGLYRQDYCGCVYSKREAEQRKDR